MNLEDIVAGRELCERLRELDFPQTGVLFYWYQRTRNFKKINKYGVVGLDKIFYAGEHPDIFLAAPTAEELIKIIASRFNEYAISYNDSGCFYHFCSGNRGASSFIGDIQFTSEQNRFIDALTEFVIWLVENGYVRFDEKVD